MSFAACCPTENVRLQSCLTSPPPAKPDIQFSDTCPEEYAVCLDNPNGKKLALYLLELQDWIAEARTRCVAPAAPSQESAP
jgi:hypothetical protein